MEKIPAYRIRLPSHRYGTLVGIIEQDAFDDGYSTMVRFRSDWTDGVEDIWIPIRLYRLPGGTLGVYTDQEFIDKYLH